MPTSNPLPEGWRMSHTVRWGNEYADYETRNVSLFRWKPARLTKFRKRVVPGKWTHFKHLWAGRDTDYTQSAARQVTDLAREVISLTEKDEARLGIKR